jgi:probable phosphoglycerate mutase
MTERQYRQSRFRRPPGATDVLLVRHGESEPAVPGVPFAMVDGHGDPALAPEGRDHAAAVAERLADQGIDAIYVTNLEAHGGDAAPLAARLGLARWSRRTSRRSTSATGRAGSSASAWPRATRRAADAGRGALGRDPRRRAAGRVRRRVRAGVQRIVAAHPDQRVAVFTHGGVIGQLLSEASGGRPFAFVGSDNGSISHLVAMPDRWVVRRFNDTSHLGSGIDLPEPAGGPEGRFSA